MYNRLNKSVLKFIFIFCIGYSMTCIGQSDEPRPIDGRIFTFGVGLGYFIPSGQLAQRYGTTLQFSVNAE